MKIRIITCLFLSLLIIQPQTQTQFEFKKFINDNKIHFGWGSVTLLLAIFCYYTNNNKKPLLRTIDLQRTELEERSKTIDSLREENKNYKEENEDYKKLSFKGMGMVKNENGGLGDQVFSLYYDTHPVIAPEFVPTRGISISFLVNQIKEKNKKTDNFKK